MIKKITHCSHEHSFFFRFGCLQFVFSITNYEDDIDKNDEANFSLRSETKTEIKTEEVKQDEENIEINSNSNSEKNNEFIITDTKSVTIENNVEMKDDILWEEKKALIFFTENWKHN